MSAVSAAEHWIWRVASVAILAAFVAALVSVFGIGRGKLPFPGADFESGDLEGWTRTGSAFANQPTFGDNTRARGKDTSGLQGSWWIGTYEDRSGPKAKRGGGRGDEATGTLTSPVFTITHDRLMFLLGGGDGTRKTGVALLVDGEEVHFAPGRGVEFGTERMRRVVWDVSSWRGQEATVRIVDESAGGWGHINVDDFRLQ